MHRLALTLLFTSACVANGDEGFHIVHNLAAPSDCTYKPGGPFLSGGLIDTISPEPYVLTPEIESRIVLAEGQSAAQKTISLRGARVEVLNAQTNTTIGKFTSLFSASLSPGGKVAVAFPIVQPEHFKAVGATGTTRVQLLAKITAYGALGGAGDEVDSVQFQYPVTVCDGCVAQVLGTCPLVAGTPVVMPSNPCHTFQDNFVQCCSSNGQLVCPALVDAPAAQ